MDPMVQMYMERYGMSQADAMATYRQMFPQDDIQTQTQDPADQAPSEAFLKRQSAYNDAVASKEAAGHAAHEQKVAGLGREYLDYVMGFSDQSRRAHEIMDKQHAVTSPGVASPEQTEQQMTPVAKRMLALRQARVQMRMDR